MAEERAVFLRNAGTHAVITGGTQGLGLAIAKRLVLEGATKIAIGGRNAARGEAAAEEIRALGADCLYVPTDVAKVEDCYRLVDRAIEAFGVVNALVNAAATTSRGTLPETTPALWDEHMNTNARGPLLTMQRVVGHLVETGRPGSIVNILSMSAACGQSFLVPYAASKAALATLTKNVANAYRGHRIRCNGINAGWMDTPGEAEIQKTFHGASDDWLAQAEATQPMGQLVKPDQLAPLVTYILSPESGVMTGALIDYDQNVAGAYQE